MSIEAATLDSASAARPPVRMSVSREAGGEELSNVNTELSFWDLLDAVNPLQHIPVIGTLYRNITGDTIQPAARAVGGILYGGPIGGLAAVANAVVEQINGKDIGDQVMASLGLGADDHPAASPDAGAVKTGSPAVVAGLPAQPPAGQPPAGQAAASQAAPGQAAGPSAAATAVANAGQAPTGAQPIRLAAAASPAVQAPPTNPAAPGTGANPTLVAQLAGQDGQPFSRPSKMPARDTNLANTMQAKHMSARAAAPMPGSTTSAAAAGQQAGTQAAVGQSGGQSGGQGAFAAVTPDRLSETMMRNLAKYEQSRRAGQATAAAVRVSG